VVYVPALAGDIGRTAGTAGKKFGNPVA